MDVETLTFRPVVGTSIIIVMDGAPVSAMVVSVQEDDDGRAPGWNRPGKGKAVCRTAAPVDVTVQWEQK